MNRWKNYGLWVSFASLILMGLQLFGVHIATDKYDTIVNGLLSFLVAAGILSNPTTQNKGYLDDPTTKN